MPTKKSGDNKARATGRASTDRELEANQRMTWIEQGGIDLRAKREQLRAAKEKKKR